jgi:hypothetical protein
MNEEIIKTIPEYKKENTEKKTKRLQAYTKKYVAYVRKQGEIKREEIL